MQCDLVVRAQAGDLDSFAALTAGRTDHLSVGHRFGRQPRHL
jgi:hypothetical protein